MLNLLKMMRLAEAVKEYVARAVENTDVENYTLADVVTEISYSHL